MATQTWRALDGCLGNSERVHMLPVGEATAEGARTRDIGYTGMAVMHPAEETRSGGRDVIACGSRQRLERVSNPRAKAQGF